MNKKLSRLSSVLNHKISVAFSITLTCLGSLLYLISDLVSKYFCSDFLYSKAFGECSDSYEYSNLIAVLTLIVTGLTIVFSLLLKDRSHYLLYLKLFLPIIIIGLLLIIGSIVLITKGK